MNVFYGCTGQSVDPETCLAKMGGKTADPTMTALATPYGCLATAHGNIRNEFEILAAITGNPYFTDPQLAERARDLGIVATLIHAYLEHGIGVFKLLAGHFSAAIIDGRTSQTLLATDRSAVHPVVYTLTNGQLVFGSSLDLVKRHPSVKSKIDPQAIYDFVFFHMIPSPGTIYTDHNRLLPGQYLRYTNGKAETGFYWELQFTENTKLPFEELKETFLDTVKQAVQDAAVSKRTGAFLSGGTDSSTISGMLGIVTGKPAETYSIGFEAEGYDEMEYARIAAHHFGTHHHEYYVTPDDVARSIPLIAAAYDQPFGNSSAVPSYYCAKFAKADGIELLLGGDGGDELFGGNTRYAKQKIFSLYEAVPESLRRIAIEPLAFGIPGGKAFMPLRKLRSYIEQASVPLPARLETYNLLNRLGAANVFTAEFLATINIEHPFTLMNSIYQGAHAKTQINRLLALDIKFTLADNDLPKVTQTCNLSGVNAGFPLLDDNVVAFSAALAPELKLKGTRLRYFFKEALRGFLPDAILTKSKHGFGLPFGEWLRNNEALQTLSYDSLESLKGRGIIQAGFIDELRKLHQIHSGYYGTMIWVLMMLEQWFRAHQDID